MKCLRQTLLCITLGCVVGAAWADQDQQGKKVFDKWCAACHAPGDQTPGTLALNAKYKGAIPAALEDRQDLSPAMVTYFVRHGISVMPFFRKTEISDAELETLTRYLQKKPPESPQKP
ncbi:Cytochrome C oxidase, cbb3-type, subunit III [Pseudomonas sp. NFACC23-1]|uniref:c-type cytochrome n=1 Tax=unclassified Pseudomonas TaxID=196821 RepID=UPI00088DE4A1|nr:MULTISPECIES: cytochrome c [unclassified Pseudomonas]SDB50726.1 Cytochrome C oxidase, cbb3-type, subunit III [Pseudomonas sp. NFACC17-2]SEI92491.1 Cytochrome C oxidase, cbb3-type, subunit III [Pseudomonas sp. NFACC23-1]SFW85077.1 Cytochrome C oxidase, cbb3-type, subunit III [Pseudomonas sp. NFACC16-2]